MKQHFEAKIHLLFQIPLRYNRLDIVHIAAGTVSWTARREYKKSEE